MAQYTRYGGGAACLALAGFFVMRGRIDAAMLIGSFGLYLLGYGNVALPPWMSRTKPLPGRMSRVRSAMLEMELDHDTGAMRGTVLAGRYAGRALADLERADIETLARECAADADSARLLDAYADRRFPGWREAGDGDGDTRQRGTARPGAMSKEEAYQILGLQPGAGEAEVRAAHRALMKRVHPDQGGSTFLAAKVNEAKEVLLGRHG
jgi:hypothetical protein